jgi:hypothetical protein
MTKSLRFASLNILVDNGVYEIYVGSDGKIHIKFILPDPPPEALAELRAVSAVLNEASKLQNRATAERFEQFAASMLNSRSKELNEMMNRTQETALAS